MSVVRFSGKSLWMCAVLALAACGGGGGNGGGPSGPPGMNTAPTISGQPATSVNEGEAYDFSPSAQDAEGDTLTFSVRNMPAWATFDAASGRLSGTPSGADVGLDSDVVITVSDGQLESSLAPFSVEVRDVNQAPVIDAIGLQTAATGVPFTVQVSATDPDGGAPLTYKLVAGPSGMTMSASGLISWTPVNPTTAPLTVEVSVTDGGQPASSSRTSFQVSVVRADPPESTISRPNADIVINSGQAVSFSGTGTDPGGRTPLSFEWDFGDSAIAAASGANPAPVVFKNPGSYTVKLTAANALGLRDPTPDEIRVEVRNGGAVVLPQTGWMLVRVDSEETTVPSEDGRGTNAFDGNINTFWHTRWAVGSTAPRPPHEIVIDLGATYELEGFRYLPRQDANVSGQIAEYAFYVSLDGNEWGPAVAQGIFNLDKSEKEVRFAQPVEGSFIRLIALSEINGGPWTTVAELKMLGRGHGGNLAPVSTITGPASDVVIGVGQQVTFAGTGSDADGAQAGLGYRWDFGAAGLPASDLAAPGAVTFSQAGTYLVQFTVSDELGRIDPTPARRIIKVVEPGAEPRLPKATWRIHFVDSEKVASPAALAASAIDGDTATVWRTTANPNGERLPHELQIDLGQLMELDGFRYLPPQDGQRSGRVTDYEIFLSEDAQFWGLPVALGTFADSASEKRVLFAPRRAQFVRFVARGAATGTSTAAAEVELEGKPATCDAPFARLLEPKRNAVQPDRLSVRLSVCLNAQQHAGWKAQVLVDGQPKATLQQAPWSTAVTGLTAANYTVKVQLVDAAGAAVTAAGAFDEVTNVGIGDYYVALGDSITNGVGDTDASDNLSADGRNQSAGYTPILNNLLTQAKGYPHTVVNEGVNGATTFAGMEKMPVMLARHPRANIVLIGLGTNDNGREPRPSGLGKKPGDTGYAGSYKANMQAMYDMAKAAGKKVYFQKAPYPSRAVALLEDYNRVIDELVAENGITVTPPDLYTYFAGTYTTEYFDALHPNAAGYRAMADLWKQALAP